MNDKKIIFILGHGRSGTTLLNKVLNAHPDIHFFSMEFNDLPFFYYRRDLYRKYNFMKYYIMSKDFFNHPSINLEPSEIKANNHKEFIDGLFDHFRNKTGKKIIGVKVADNIFENVNLINSILNDAYVIHIIRDPRDIRVSLKKTDFWGLGATSPFYFGKSWKDIINKISSLRNKIKKYYEIGYESLITNPEKEIKKLCKFLEIPFYKQMLEFYKYTEDNLPGYHTSLKKDFIKDNYNKWKNELTKKELFLIYASAGKKMYELGYLDKKCNIRISFLRRLHEYTFDKINFYFNSLKPSIRKYKRRYIEVIRRKRQLGLK